MATANFYPYDVIPNFYFMTRDEIEQRAAYSDDFNHDPDNDDPDAYWDKLDAWIDEHYKGYRIVDDYELQQLEEALDDINDKIKAKTYGYDVRKQRDLEESWLLEDIQLVIKGGYYEGYQIAIEGHREYLFEQLNKTNQRWIIKMLKQVARRFYLPQYCLAYRFSNGEAGFTKIKDYKPTKRDLAAGMC